MAAVRLEAVAKTYPNGHTAIRHVDLGIDEGEFLMLVGPSGCGKSTLLRLIGGLETPTFGRIVIGGADVTGLPPQARDLAMAFQSYALYPHMSVRDNLAYGLKVRRTDRAVVAQRVDVYARPTNTFVARFIGAPAMNLVPATLVGVDTPSGAVVGIRPQDVTLVASGQLHAVVDLVEPRGHDHLLHLRLDSPGASPFLVVVAGTAPPAVGAQVFVRIPPDRLHLFNGRHGARLP